MTQITRDMLMAYADGQLDPAQRKNVEAHLAAYPEAAAEIALSEPFEKPTIANNKGIVQTELIPHLLYQCSIIGFIAQHRHDRIARDKVQNTERDKGGANG